MNKFTELRRRAEKLLETQLRSVPAPEMDEYHKLFHELDTYRVELELQNTELQKTYLQLFETHKQLRETHFRHYEIAPVGYVSLNQKNLIVDINQTLAAMLGYDKKTLLNHALTDFIHHRDQDRFYFCHQKLIETQAQQSSELRFKHAKRNSLWVKLDCVFEKTAQAHTVHIAINDISRLKSLENDLSLAASVFDECLEAFLVTDANQKIVKVNKAFTEMTGYAEHEVMGKHPKILQSGKHDKQFFQHMWSQLNDHQQWKGEIWNRRKNGEIYPEWLTISALRNSDGQITHYIGLGSDITHRKHSEAHIHFMAYYDPLTRLPNRSLLEDRLSMELAHTRRHHNHGALMILDVDHFKVVNDSLGHLVGDQLLQEVAKRLTACVREEDTVSRMGGDEFMVLLVDLNAENANLQASQIASKILHAVSQTISTPEHTLHITVSIGIVIFPADADQPATLMRLADNAMYKAKNLGRNTFQFFTPNLQQEADKRLCLQNDLRYAIDRHEFELYYQPQIHIKTHAIISAESLLRWNHPQHGVVLPGGFMAVAEESRLIIPIGTWVLEQTCRQIASWNKIQTIPLQHVSVNVSNHQFHQHNFIDELQRIISQSDITPQQLTLELTESILIKDLKEAHQKLEKLKKMGIPVAIDDFGTGYSSLDYIRRLPLDVLKIDQSFIHDIGSDAKDEAILKIILSLAKNLKLRAIAEGVETRQQHDFLKKHACDSYQGTYYKMPLKAEAYLQLVLAAQPSR